MLCCTRAVGAEPPVALNAQRGIVSTIVVEQTTGAVAALAANAIVHPWDVDLRELQNALREDGVVLDIETVEFDCEIPEDRVSP